MMLHCTELYKNQSFKFPQLIQFILSKKKIFLAVCWVYQLRPSQMYSESEIDLFFKIF